MFKLESIHIDLISVDGRFREDFGNIDQLKKSIEASGLIQPLAVMTNGDTYLLLAGGRRYQALKELGKTLVPVRIYDELLSERERRTIELSENFFRKNLEWKEETKLIQEIHRLMIEEHGTKSRKGLPRTTSWEDTPGWSVTDTANLLGVDQAQVARDLEVAEFAAVPQLKEARNKTEASKLIQKFKRTFQDKKLVERVVEAKKDETLDEAKAKLIDSYFLGDFFELTKNIPTSTFDLVELDPPYGIDLHTRHGKTNAIYDNMPVEMEEYQEVEAEDYPEFMTRVLGVCFNLLKPGGWLILWHSPTWFCELQKITREFGFSMADIPGIWKKTVATTMNVERRLVSSYEPFLYGSKGPGNPLHIMARGNVFDFSSRHARIHPAERPIEMIQYLLDTFVPAGSNILCPFGGSGNTVLAANNLHMTCTTFDLSEKFRNGYIRRVMDGEVGKYRSYNALPQD